jgi:chromosome segregation ATPase
MRVKLFLALVFVAGNSAFMTDDSAGQTNPTDSQTLQSILAEVRQLRRELLTVSVAAQRAQVLIYRLQAQESAVRRLRERADDWRSKLTQIEQEKSKLSEEVKLFEDSLRHNQSDDPAAKKEADQTLVILKARLESDSNEEQEIQTKVADAEELLRVEQAKLERLQDELDRWDQMLQQSSVTK